MTYAPSSQGGTNVAERGVITAMFAVLLVFIMLIVGVLAESGRKLSNLSRAEDIAAEASRSAAATLNLSKIANGIAEIDGPERAKFQADLIVDSIADAEIVTFTVEADRVLVRVQVSGTSFIPGFSVDAIGSHQALAYDPFG